MLASVAYRLQQAFGQTATLVRRPAGRGLIGIDAGTAYAGDAAGAVADTTAALDDARAAALPPGRRARASAAPAHLRPLRRPTHRRDWARRRLGGGDRDDAPHAQARPALPARQVRWTRLGNGMGYTNTEPKRAAIRAAVEAMVWVDPEQLARRARGAAGAASWTGLFYCAAGRWPLPPSIAAADDRGQLRPPDGAGG